MTTAELKWLPIPPDLWIPAGLKDFQEGWFVNLLRASLRSENTGYLILCKEGCSGCPACLWRVANAHHPEYFRKHSSLVLACFNSAQIAGRQVLYFPKLVDTLSKQLSKIRNHRSRGGVLSETSTGFHKGGGVHSPSDSLSFDFDSDSKKQENNLTTSNTREALPMREPKFSEQTVEQQTLEIKEGAQRILRILGLSDTLFQAAKAAVEAELKGTRLSMDGVVQRITTEANRAERTGVSREEFLDDFLAQASARRALGILNLSITKNLISRVAAVLKAEAKDTGLPVEEAASRITLAATEDRRRGARVDIFYFEDFKWRSNAGINKAEKRKLDNLEVNARFQQRLKERFGHS
jgi:hypothetical protein